MNEAYLQIVMNPVDVCQRRSNQEAALFDLTFVVDLVDLLLAESP